MSKMKYFLSMVRGFAVVGAVSLGVFFAFGWLVRPDIYADLPEYDPEEVAKVEALRDVSFDLDDPVVLYVTVDYSEGEDAAWYPRGESPMLAELVEEGVLPPVAERVGPEPAVIEGVDGTGNYGGTWHRTASSEGDIATVMQSRMSTHTLIAFSPMGYPLKPRLLREWEASEDFREFTLHMRRGVRWSDGHPFTADDILFWWEIASRIRIPYQMRIRGGAGDIEKVDEYTLRVTFPHPYPAFPDILATMRPVSPSHYLRPFHPEFGDPEKIERLMDDLGVGIPWAAYDRINAWNNPERPSLGPWVLREYRSSGPYEFVRNPYYWAVDTEGNQLPYIDRIYADVRESRIIPMAAAAGNITMQLRELHFEDHTLYMTNREAGDYEVYFWRQGLRSTYCLFPNLNRRIIPGDPATAWKHKYFNKPEFRKALSLAIDRKTISLAEHDGLTEPAQLAPGSSSPFYNPRLYKAYTEYDPERANAMLDEIGLKRGGDGYRTFPDGTQMVLLLNSASQYTGVGPAKFIIRNWSDVGVRAILFDRERSLWSRMAFTLEHDLQVWMGECETYPVLNPRNFVPQFMWAPMARGYGAWYSGGGLYGEPVTEEMPFAIEPREDHPLRRAMHIYDDVLGQPTLEDQAKVFNEILEIAADNLWTINTTSPPPQVVIVDRNLRNVPRNALVAYQVLTPSNAGIDTYFFEEPRDTPETVGRIKDSIREVRPDPSLPAWHSGRGGGGSGDSEGVEVNEAAAGRALGSLIRFLIYGTLALLVVSAAVKHPFILRRIVILLPTLLIISVVIFTIIQIPPGDFISHRIMELQMQGDDAALQRVEDLKEVFRLDDPKVVRYLDWMGVYWFGSFAPEDRGLLQGHMGTSMEHVRPVNELVGDRILLTVLISLFTILFTWAVAVPIGVYAAVRQYSFADYITTFFGFIGLSIPNFLLALVLMYIGVTFFDTHVGGLFSPEFATQPYWDWPKVKDLMERIWIPVIVIGTAGTAGMIRVMRANLLDELRKPYVVTARAKGLRPVKLLLKYPVRLALNPFVSGIGNIFPRLVSGGAIVALVLSLPTVGPLLLSALMTQDMYLAGSMLMVLSLLTVFGTLVSDLLLMWVDPRIRMSGN